MINVFFEKLGMDMVQSLFYEMVEKDCFFDSYIYRVLIDGFCKVGNENVGYKYLLEKIEKGFIFLLVICGRVFNCFCVKYRVYEVVGIV